MIYPPPCSPNTVISSSAISPYGPLYTHGWCGSTEPPIYTQDLGAHTTTTSQSQNYNPIRALNVSALCRHIYIFTMWTICEPFSSAITAPSLEQSEHIVSSCQHARAIGKFSGQLPAGWRHWSRGAWGITPVAAPAWICAKSRICAHCFF